LQLLQVAEYGFQVSSFKFQVLSFRFQVSDFGLQLLQGTGYGFQVSVVAMDADCYGTPITLIPPIPLFHIQHINFRQWRSSYYLVFVFWDLLECNKRIFLSKTLSLLEKF
jgi:hypothetical protein